jgi:hypothetical protein
MEQRQDQERDIEERQRESSLTQRLAGGGIRACINIYHELSETDEKERKNSKHKMKCEVNKILTSEI